MLESLAPYLLWIHLTTLFVLLPLILWADHMGWSWFRGRVLTLPASTTGRIHTAVWCGFTVMIVSGFLMFYPYRDYLLFEATFRAKMAFVTALFLNALFIGRINERAAVTSYAELPPRERVKFLFAGGISTLSWIGAATMGLLLDL